MKEFLTVRQYTERFPWPTESGLRALIYGAFNGKNPFRPAFKKVSRRVLINVQEMHRIIEEINPCPEGKENASNVKVNLQQRGRRI